MKAENNGIKNCIKPNLDPCFEQSIIHRRDLWRNRNILVSDVVIATFPKMLYVLVFIYKDGLSIRRLRWCWWLSDSENFQILVTFSHIDDFCNVKNRSPILTVDIHRSNLRQKSFVQGNFGLFYLMYSWIQTNNLVLNQ